jgi:hypothetical protein
MRRRKLHRKRYADLEVQLTMRDTVITEKGITDKKGFYLPKNLVDKFDGYCN